MKGTSTLIAPNRSNRNLDGADGILRKRIKSSGISLSTDDTVEASVNNLSNFNYRDSLIVSGTNASRGPSEHEAESGQIRVNSHIASRGPSEHEAESGQIRVNSHIASRGPSEHEAEGGQIRVNSHIASRGTSEHEAESGKIRVNSHIASRGPSEHEAESGQIRVNSHIASRGPSEHEAESGQIRVNSHIASRGPSEHEAESGQIRVNSHVASRGSSENVAEMQRRVNEAQERALLAQNNDNERMDGFTKYTSSIRFVTPPANPSHVFWNLACFADMGFLVVWFPTTPPPSELTSLNTW
ncbi:unnamed protein product [Orchesella dallaii]|uniref:Uncharacterized protein n=1 Tax=Orchesella dallaii TaxID=48710 RepID=A0ABP1S042_9HEXA